MYVEMEPVRLSFGFVDETDVRFNMGQYGDGSAAIDAWWNDELLAHVTTRVRHFTPDEGCVLIKDYSENDGIALALEDLALISPTGRSVPSGFVELHEYELRGPFKLAWQRMTSEETA